MDEILIELAKNAGHHIMTIYQQLQTDDIMIKNDGSPVTIADKVANDIIVDGLKKHYPHIPIISEEDVTSHHHVSSEFFLIDPIDGTKEFIKPEGSGDFTVNIALIRHYRPVIGVVYAPVYQHLYIGDVHKGAFYDKGNGLVKAVPRLYDKNYLIAVTSKSHRDTQTNAFLKQHHIADIMGVGSSLKFCLLVDGTANIYPRFVPTSEWDTAAGDAILQAAGGIIITPDNCEPLIYGKKNYRNSDFIALSDKSYVNDYW